MALDATRQLIESLAAGRWHIITAARLEGAWVEIAQSMNYVGGADDLRVEYTDLVDWYATHPSVVLDVDRWRAAIGS